MMPLANLFAYFGSFRNSASRLVGSTAVIISVSTNQWSNAGLQIICGSKYKNESRQHLLIVVVVLTLLTRIIKSVVTYY